MTDEREQTAQAGAIEANDPDSSRPPVCEHGNEHECEVCAFYRVMVQRIAESEDFV
jgi:hypothetical protein